MHCLLHYFDTLSIDKKHNSQNVLHVVTIKSTYSLSTHSEQRMRGWPRTQTKIFHNNKVILYWYMWLPRTCMHLWFFLDHLREAWYLGSLICLWHEILTFQYLGQLWSEMSKNIPSNYVINDCLLALNDQVSNLLAIWSCVH